MLMCQPPVTATTTTTTHTPRTSQQSQPAAPLPSPAGNWVGGAIMVGTFYACVYGTNIPAAKDKLWDATLGKVIPQLP